MAEKLDTRITLGSPKYPVRFSYAYVFEARESDDEDDDDGNKKMFYSTMVLIDKRDTDTVSKFKSNVNEVVKADFQGKSANLKLPLRDGDEEADEKGDYVKGYYFFNCKSKKKPQVVGTEKNDLTGKLEPIGPGDEPFEFKSGDWGRVSVNLYSFGTKPGAKSKGVAVGLGNIQKLKDGEPLSASRSADADFGDLDEGFGD